MTETPPQALSHIKVLDLSRILAGPWCTQLLGDMGAQVIKVENTVGGDDTRGWGPPFVDEETASPDAAYYTACNRNKLAIAVNIKTSEGCNIIRQLAAQSDVLVENFKVGGLAKYGLDYESLKTDNPSLIYCSITGFGQTGPYSQRAGYDFLIQGMGGLMSITGQPDGAPGAEPVKAGVAITDLFTGLYAANAIQSALIYRSNSGMGQHIDCSLLSSQVAMLANQASNWLVGNQNPQRMGNNHPNVVPYRAFKAADAFVIITCGNDGQFNRLCEILEITELLNNPDYATNALRIQHREKVDSAIQRQVEKLTRADLMQLCESAGVPCGPINDVANVFADPHVDASGMTVNLYRAEGLKLPGVGQPVRLSASPASYRLAPPAYAQDTDTVLQSELGLSTEYIARLRKEGHIV